MTHDPDAATLGSIGTPDAANATTLLLLGSGELGKELVFAAQRLGVETVAVDRYENAPAMQAAHDARTIDMTDADALRAVVEDVEPAVIVPEIEAVATAELERLEADGYDVVPTAEATRLTMDREWIREFAAEEVGVPTSDYRFADGEDAYRAALDEIGRPAVVKPTMSSSGKGQSVVREGDDPADAWRTATEGSRSDTGRVIVEELVDLDYEVTLLTVRHADGTTVCPPVGHRQVDGDYRESWQPHPMDDEAAAAAERMARAVTDGLGGHGIFGVEFFVVDGEVLFSELSPRPHDTGLVTLATQSLDQFELHLRAILGLPIPAVRLETPGASAALVADEPLSVPAVDGVADALAGPAVDLRLFGKPDAYAGRRMGVAVAADDDTEGARERASEAVAALTLRDADGASAASE
ncbi:formate-dependent phosphoribosylglycinamide formyltransferase [Halobaculum sp. MBLA0147]|uniref:formate-dependent phosphoribosylglycinamide formyltransferase n=1 Tax=Halobaculum sp. MBLA0147 TaxID=3079934 RepID=UPI003523DC59